jgi:hypothetical protein
MWEGSWECLSSFFLCVLIFFFRWEGFVGALNSVGYFRGEMQGKSQVYLLY